MQWRWTHDRDHDTWLRVIVRASVIARPGPVRVTHADIARRAHELFVAGGGRHGHDLDDWLQAERALQRAAASDELEGCL